MFKTVLSLVFWLLAPHAAAGESGQPGSPAIAHQDMHFFNGKVELAGTLYYPAQGQHLPAVVVEHGAAMPTRDYRLYAHLTEALPAMGIAVLVYDRRGSGGSTGAADDAGFEELADDAIAGQRALARDPRIDAHNIGFWGLSQGGWLAVLAANRSHDAAFAVSVSAPLVTPDVQMNFATRNLLLARGYSEQDVALALAARRAHDAYTRGQLDRAQTLRALERADHEPWSALTFLPSAPELTTAPATSVWHKQMQHDPLVEVGKARVPVLFIYGGADPWVPVHDSVGRLVALMRTHPNFETRVIAGANHTMQRLDKDEMAFDSATLKAEAPDAPAYFVVLADWLARHVIRRQAAP